mmetsp:Transcript_24363/g.65908  ORF Transcript_24363/g.65908 Transcript_24363/m.65908 type:complete len:118 (-) Transcript_24363:103-456(-)
MGAKGGHGVCLHQLGYMYHNGEGVDVDYKQGLAWSQKAVALDYSSAHVRLGTMYGQGDGVVPSWRRAREYYARALELGDRKAEEGVYNMSENIRTVTNERTSKATTPPSLPCHPTHF